MNDLNNLKEEFELAKKIRKNAHDPYTNYKVGAILVGKSGENYSGCNILNHGIQSICAERVAFAKAISEGEKEFERIVIVGGKEECLEECLPCGYCRQFMSEFVNEDFLIYTINGEKIREYRIDELLPFNFKI